jgi:hypothetical protein
MKRQRLISGGVRSGFVAVWCALAACSPAVGGGGDEDAAPPFDGAADAVASNTPDASADAADSARGDAEPSSDAGKLDAAEADDAADASVDAPSDGSFDAAPDAAVDASTDATFDAATDATLDAGGDATLDAGGDATLDAATDGGQDENDASDASPDGPTSAGHCVDVSDAGDAGVLVTSGASFFGAIPCGTPPPSSSFTIQNPTSASVSWTASPTGVAIDQSGGTLAPGQCITVGVSLAAGLGFDRGSVSIDDGQNLTVLDYFADVYGLSAGVVPSGGGPTTGSPAPIDFGTVNLGPDSTALTLPDGGTLWSGLSPPVTRVVNLTGIVGAAGVCSEFLTPPCMVNGPGSQNFLGGTVSACGFPTFLNVVGGGGFMSGAPNTGFDGVCSAQVTFNPGIVSPGTYSAVLSVGVGNYEAPDGGPLPLCGPVGIPVTIQVLPPTPDGGP